MGNVTEFSLRDIWKRYLVLRKEWQRQPEECRDCKNAKVCSGGCKTHSYLKWKRFDKKDPLCNGENIPTIWC